MKTKNHITLLLTNCLLILCGCSSEERFDCDGIGLIRNGKLISFGNNNLKFCEKQGVNSRWIDTDDKCSDVELNDYTSFLFDEVTNVIRLGSIKRQCKKLN